MTDRTHRHHWIRRLFGRARIALDRAWDEIYPAARVRGLLEAAQDEPEAAEPTAAPEPGAGHDGPEPGAQDEAEPEGEWYDRANYGGWVYPQPEPGAGHDGPEAAHVADDNSRAEQALAERDTDADIEASIEEQEAAAQAARAAWGAGCDQLAAIFEAEARAEMALLEADNEPGTAAETAKAPASAETELTAAGPWGGPIAPDVQPEADKAAAQARIDAWIADPPALRAELDAEHEAEIDNYEELRIEQWQAEMEAEGDRIAAGDGTRADLQQGRTTDDVLADIDAALSGESPYVTISRGTPQLSRMNNPEPEVETEAC